MLVSTDVALLVAKPDDLQRAYRDPARVRGIATSIAERGQTHPVEILVDSDGRCAIRDGHHRLVATLSLGITEVAVEFIPVQHRIPGFARRADQVLSAIARTSARDELRQPAG